MNAILEKIAIDVTAEQIGKCAKTWKNGEDYYSVENSRGICDGHGVIEYEVHYDALNGFSCNCEAGKRGFSNCKNFCWHVRAACAMELEMRTAIAEQARKIDEDRGEGRAAHASAVPAIVAIEVKWNIPTWMLNAPVAPHMKKATKER